MQRILVTGWRGFVGSRVLELLRGMGRTAVCFDGDVRRPRHGDASSGQAPADVDAVIHAAALITHRGDVSANAYREVNVEGTRALLAAYPDCKFVFASTTDVTRPTLSAYAESKRDAELLVGARASTCVVRLPSVFGPGQRQATKLIPRLLRRHVLGESAFEITHDVRRYCFVDDAAMGLIAALDDRGTTEVAGTSVSNAELNDLIAAAAQGAPASSVPAHLCRFYGQLRVCVEDMQARDKEVA